MSAGRGLGRRTGKRRSRTTECTSTYLAWEQVDSEVDASPEETNGTNGRCVI